MIIREEHLVSDFIVHKKTPSTLVPGKMLVTSVFRCPICAAEQPKPKHGKTETCRARCGASWTAMGNGLELSFTEQRTFLQRVVPSMLR